MRDNGNSAASDDPTRPARQFRATACNQLPSTRVLAAEAPPDLVDPEKSITLSRSQVQAMLAGTPGARIGPAVDHGNDSKLRRLLRRVARMLS